MKIKISEKNIKELFLCLLLFSIPFFSSFRPILSKFFHIHIFIMMYMPFFMLLFMTMLWNINLSANKNLIYLLVYYICLLPFSCDIKTGLLSIMNLIIAMYISSGLNKQELNEKCGLAFVIGLLICNVILLPPIITQFGFNLEYMYTVRIPYMEGDVSVGPNGWGQYLTLAVMLMLLLMYHKRNITVPYSIMFASLFVFIYLTQSRAQLLSAMVVTLFAVMIVFEQSNQSLITKCIIAIAIFVGIVLLIMIIETGDTRYSYDDLSTLGNRSQIWDIGFTAFIEKTNPLQWFFGVGTGGTGVFIAQGSNSGEAYINSHSMYLDSLIMSGLVGTVLLINYWCRTFFVLFRHRRESLAFVFPLWVLFLGISTHFFANWPYLFAMIVSEVEIKKYIGKA